MATPASGSGTVGDPYLITSAEELVMIDDDAANLAAHYKQVNDITGVTSGVSGTFSGSYDGQGYGIDVAIDLGATGGGLFQPGSGTCQRIHLTGTIESTGFTAGINSGKATNCRVDATITGGPAGSGIGKSQASLFTSTVTADSYYGINSATQTNCYYDKDVLVGATDEAVHGLITEVLQSGDLPEGFDPEIWYAEEGQYPRLRTPDMAITTNTPAVRPGGKRASDSARPFCVNATSADATGNETLLAAVTGATHFITDLLISCATATTVVINSGTSALLGPYTFTTGGHPVSLHFTNPVPAASGAALAVDAAGAGVVTVTLQGFTLANDPT